MNKTTGETRSLRSRRWNPVAKHDLCKRKGGRHTHNGQEKGLCKKSSKNHTQSKGFDK